MTGPLAGVTVLEMAGIGPGPFAAMMLADMGARVIRIDRIPSGKKTGLQAMLNNDSLVDRGRESVAVNLKDPAGVAVVLSLAARADALIEGYRPGVMEKLGLGPEVMRAQNPKLVYGRMTGWGQHGPLAQAAGHDLNYIALTGALHAIGPSDRPPAVPLNLVGDYGGGGMLMAMGVCAALFEAARSGQGQVLDVAMTDGAALLMAAMYGMKANGHWHDRRESNFLDGAAPFYANYACADGKYVAIGAIEPQFYATLMERCGIQSPEMAAQWDAAAWPRQREILGALFLTRTRDEWCTLLEGSDACFAPVLSLTEAPAHPHNKARATFVESGGVMQPAPAPRFDRTPSALPGGPPEVGQHTRAVLAEFGHRAEDIERLSRSAGVYCREGVAG